jgi:hypothetical protein
MCRVRLGLTALAFLAACAPERPDREGDPPRWDLVEELTIGAGSAGAPISGSITAIAVDSTGQMYLFDGQVQQLHVYAADGTYERSIGRRGDGPGEFRGATDVAIRPSGEILVVDSRNQRYSLFRPSGALIGDHSRRLRGSLPGAGAFLADGRYLDWSLSFPGETEEVVGGARVVCRPVLLDRDFNISDSLAAFEYRREMAANGTIPMPFFANRLLVAPLPDSGILFAESRRYHIFERTAAGDTALIVSAPVDGVPVREEDRAQIRDQLAGRPELRSAYLPALPERRPVIRRLFSDGAGRVFVLAAPAARGGRYVLEGFDRSGTPLGRAFPPEGLEDRPAPLVVGDRLYAVVRDEVDVPRLVRFRIRPRGP